ncbi:MAG TPA: ribosome biogenesis GTPase Der [Acidimicrobiales bacterium]|nr:ribosome biogenesis GTPase Der [Acidimicrobiales bacterium]HLH46637.1 ribosome biogenesis GTPase Der [Acidimicrobiales bacterium]
MRAATGALPRRPTVVVAGRPNVGKSSLVNRIVGRRVAVVEREPGVTRDRNVLEAEWAGVAFDLVDTGGWLPGGDALDAKVSDQAFRAVVGADLVLLVADVTVGLTEDDLAVARAVHRAGVPVLAVANKADDESRERSAWEMVALGFGDPWPVSALHGRGTGDLLDEVVRRLAPSGQPDTPPGPAAPDGPDADGGSEPPRVAIVGRPNVGKSTLFNRLIGEERSVVHDLPGTTRDAVDTLVTTPAGPVRFVDTAGMRRPARTEPGVERHAVSRALAALERAHVALLVIDASVGATHQDQRLAERIAVSGCAAVVVLNKWDLVPAERRDDVLAGVGDRLAFLGTAPVLRVSAASGRGVGRVLPALQETVRSYHQRVPTGTLNRALRELQEAHPAPGARIRYGVQGAVDPPTFTLFATGRLPRTYLRYVERRLRDRFDLGATPLKIRVRTGGGR